MSRRRKQKFHNVYQFKITLQEVEPVVWRRIQVPEIYTFWDFHVAIQDSMGWFDCHLHEFQLPHPIASGKIRIGIPDEDKDYDYYEMSELNCPLASSLQANK